MKSGMLTCFTAMTLFAALTIPLRLTAEADAARANKLNHHHYQLIDLGTLGGTFSQAFGINNNGSVVGFATLPGDSALHAFLWRDGVMTDLSTLAPTDNLPYSVAFSVNDNDEAVGLSETSTPDSLNTCGDSLVCLAVLWKEGTITALPTLGGLDGQASAINNRGQVVGIALTDEIDPTCLVPELKPAVWEKGEVHALPTAPFRDGIVGDAPGPAGNNDKGQVVGVTFNCGSSASRASLWRNHKVIDMGNIAGLPIVPRAINDSGQATGVYTTAAGINRAFVWQDGVATDLGTLPGDNFAEGGAINKRGQIVGQSCSATTCSVFLWQNGAMTDLNVMIPAGSSLNPIAAHGINSRGEIVGWGFQNATGLMHAFLAIPCDDEHANANGCEDQTTPAAQRDTGQRPNIVVPESVRKILPGRLGVRYRGGLGVPPPK